MIRTYYKGFEEPYELGRIFFNSLKTFLSISIAKWNSEVYPSKLIVKIKISETVYERKLSTFRTTCQMWKTNVLLKACKKGGAAPWPILMSN